MLFLIIIRTQNHHSEILELGSSRSDSDRFASPLASRLVVGCYFSVMYRSQSVRFRHATGVNGTVDNPMIA